MTNNHLRDVSRIGNPNTGAGLPEVSLLTASGMVPIEIIREEMKRAVVINPGVPTVSEVVAARRRGRAR